MERRHDQHRKKPGFLFTNTESLQGHRFPYAYERKVRHRERKLDKNRKIRGSPVTNAKR